MTSFQEKPTTIQVKRIAVSTQIPLRAVTGTTQCRVPTVMTNLMVELGMMPSLVAVVLTH